MVPSDLYVSLWHLLYVNGLMFLPAGLGPSPFLVKPIFFDMSLKIFSFLQIIPWWAVL